VEPYRFQQGQPMLLAGLRRKHRTDTAADSVIAQWRDFLSVIPESDRVGNLYFGAMCGGDPSGFEYLSGVEVESFDRLPEGMGRMRVPAQQYAIFRHPVGESLESTWRGIRSWLSGGSYESAHLPDFERYEAADGESKQSNIEVWVGVVAKSDHSRGAA
jgi:AraC family transcriptional regulator